MPCKIASRVPSANANSTPTHWFVCLTGNPSQNQERHTAACEKLNSKKRPVFDSSKIRAQGTELEAYNRTRGRNTGGNAPKSKHPKVLSSTYLINSRITRRIQATIK
jgi:hypothetical protein